MKYLVEVFWSDEDEGYIAVVPDLPGLLCVRRHPRGGRARNQGRR